MNEVFMPTLDKTGISFQDLYLDPNTQTVILYFHFIL